MAPTLHIVICSTRPGRVGPSVARWVYESAVRHGQFETALVDLAEFELPVFDEPKHPRLQQYEHEHTRRWSRSVSAADAFVFVTPEYNFGPPPALLNALNYVYREWNYKPAAFVSYGGIGGGLRAVQAEKLTLLALKMVPINEGVAVHKVAEHVSNGMFSPEEAHATSLAAMLTELARWAEALKPLRQPAR
ncbi:MAG TPA: NAD(P)H-dependent oxidoreductase [Microvirga sp.]|nr:NAD(P)H-dependent oxidoreductase [Microvirga sp.]